MAWRDIELNKKLFKNVDESVLTSTFSSLENCFVTEANGLSRFPGLVDFCTLESNADVYLEKMGTDIFAVSGDGKCFRIDRNANVTPIQGSNVLGGNRVSFAKTRDSLIMTAGRQIVRYDGHKNTILSKDAPLSNHVGFIDNYVLAVEAGSGRFQHSNLNAPDIWDPLNTFAAEAKSDDINAMLITPFGEIILTGEESIEQFERYPGGDAPFIRRWSIGDGLSEPYTLCHVDNAAWGLNSNYEFVRMSGQTSASASDDIQKDIEQKYSIDHLEAKNKAWATPLNIKGQKFIILQSPESTNSYGTRGFTGVFDIRRNQWFEIAGWDNQQGVPTLWQGRSVVSIWGRTFVGGQGKVYELLDGVHSNAGAVQRMYGRTAHFDTLGTIRVDRVRLTMKRGVGSYTANPQIVMRCNCDNKGFNLTQRRDIGFAGDGQMIIEFGAQGTGTTWQFEFMVTDDCPVDIRRLQVDVTPVVR
jgi:hypothetical protein